MYYVLCSVYMSININLHIYVVIQDEYSRSAKLYLRALYNFKCSLSKDKGEGEEEGKHTSPIDGHASGVAAITDDDNGKYGCKHTS